VLLPSTLWAHRSSLNTAPQSQHPLQDTSSTHTHSHTGIRSPAACQPTHSLVATQDCTALHFSSSHIMFRCANILEAWRHQPCGKPCCEEQRRYVTIYLHCSTSMLNKDNSTELNSCIAYSTKATYDVYHMGKNLKLKQVLPTLSRATFTKLFMYRFVIQL